MEDRKFTNTIHCACCSNKAPMLIVSTYSETKKHEDPTGQVGWETGNYWELIKCPACDEILLRKGDWHEHLSEYPVPDFDIVYPQHKQYLKGLPVEIDSAYRAALKVKHIDSNAYAVLLGRVLEKLCTDKSAKGKTLSEKLKYLSDQNIIPKQLSDMAHALRGLRNIGAHADSGDLTEQETPILDELCKAILEYVYVAPHLVAKAQRKLNQIKSA